MKHLVYLFELDSVRNSEREIEIGQNAIFEELTVLGHNIVISLNQLVDSRVFMSLVNDETAYKSILHLFDIGAIKISLYGTFKSASQYIQSSMEKEKFIFSNLPMNIGSQNLKTVIKEALQYSSLKELEELRDKKENESYRTQYDYLISL